MNDGRDAWGRAGKRAPFEQPRIVGKQIKLTEKHIQSFMGAYRDMVKLYESANPDKPDPKVEEQAEAVAKKNSFASLNELDVIAVNEAMIMFAIEQQTKKITEPPEHVMTE